MIDCLPATGLDAGSVAAVGLIALAVLIVGAIAIVRSRRRSAATLMMALLLVAGGGIGLSFAAPTAASAATACSTPTPTSAPAGIAGVWAGDHMEGEEVLYSIVATITDNGTTASGVVVYPDLCNGTWTQVSRTATTVVFSEVVDDPVACVDNSTITITPVGSPPTSLGWLAEAEGIPAQGATLLPAD